MKPSTKTSRNSTRDSDLVCQVKFRGGKLVALHCEEAKKSPSVKDVVGAIGAAADTASRVARAVVDIRAARR